MKYLYVKVFFSNGRFGFYFCLEQNRESTDQIMEYCNLKAIENFCSLNKRFCGKVDTKNVNSVYIQNFEN